MKARRLRLPPTPSPAVEKLRDYLRAIYAAPVPWHEELSPKLDFEDFATADTAPQPDAKPLIATMKEAQPVARNGEKGKGRSNSFDNIKANKGGNSAEYLAYRYAKP